MAVPLSDPVESSFDARWAAWVERGRQHDLALQRKLRIAFPVAAAIGLLLVLIDLTVGGR